MKQPTFPLPLWLFLYVFMPFFKLNISVLSIIFFFFKKKGSSELFFPIITGYIRIQGFSGDRYEGKYLC